MLCFLFLTLSTSFSIHEKEVKLSKTNNAKSLLIIEKSSFTNTNSHLLYEKCTGNPATGAIDAIDCILEIDTSTFAFYPIVFKSTNNDIAGYLKWCTFLKSSTVPDLETFVTVIGNRLDLIDCRLNDIYKNKGSPAFIFKDLNTKLGVPKLQFASCKNVVFDQPSSSFIELTNYPVDLAGCVINNIVFNNKDSSFIKFRGINSLQFNDMGNVSNNNLNNGILFHITLENVDSEYQYEVNNANYQNNLNTQIFKFDFTPTYYATSITIKFSNCKFTENSYIQDSSDQAAIINLCTDSSVIFEDCIFEKNNGYLIYSHFIVVPSPVIKYAKDISIIGCNFTGTTFEQRKNTSLTLFAESVTIKGSNFNDNKGKRNGGILCLLTLAEFIIENCHFNKNTCTNSDGEQSFGGAIYITYGGVDSKIKNCNFTDCQTGHFGGAIYATYLSNDKQRLITIEECNFVSCKTLVEKESFGGAITCGKDTHLKEINDGDMILKLCTFTKCESARGGAIFFFNGHEGSVYDEEKYIVECTFDNCKFFGSFGDYDNQDFGAAIYSQTYILHINQSHFKNMKDGIIYILMDEGHPPIIHDCTFESCENPFNLDLDSHVNITNCHFLNSPIVLNSDIDDIRYGLSFYDCEFKDTSSYFIRLGYDPYSLEFYIFPCSITKCTFSNFQLQSAPTYCIYVGSHVQLTLIDCEFQDLAGKSYQGGLALYIEKKRK
ncbi:hypothetical protein TRFO_28291 [Tritrichomonas foetus]|uniref:Right handed beta helix domain-containing protein n=1 Tax=Tritrichomonas foetus TaxID=1144522 RepID=A0A1J4JZ41_9EUKA|nr:hypothetical protein TRFO_28291 [Tritrichomonas foetus]|eukprot:OHT04243.1 hypothetical protein TRFO_28291 [Tritrichomonas foetus]